MKIKMIISILSVWIIYFFGWFISFKLNNEMLSYIMVLITISMIPFMITGEIVDYFKKKIKL